MISELDFFRTFTFSSIILRLGLAMLVGGTIGMEGARKGRAAGFRTYMLVCMGAALTMLLGQYEVEMLTSFWKQGDTAHTDVARFGAQVINGIGFLGAGTIIVTGKQQVKGLTTAAGLWVSACMGLAIGAGFYECCLLAFGLAFIVVRLLPGMEDWLSSNSRNMNVCVEYDRIEHTGIILNKIRELNVQILEVEIDRQSEDGRDCLSAVLTMRLGKWIPHTQIISHIMQLECVSAIEEV